MEILKSILYMLVLLSSTSIGALLSQKYQKREEELKDFKTAFIMFKTKICYTYEPLQEIFKDISKNIQSKTKIVFEKTIKYMKEKNATESWNLALEETTTNLTKEDKKALSTLGKLLGKTNIEGQINEINLSLEFLETQIENARQEKEKSAKLYKTLGAIAGIGIVIILI